MKKKLRSRTKVLRLTLINLRATMTLLLVYLALKT